MMDHQNIIRRRRTARSAFSLAELMIAIVILGLGLLMVASMFPVGWLKARELAEFTTSQSIISVAKTTVKQLSRVDGPADPAYTIAQGSSFAGDMLWNGYAATDTFVHALNLENILAMDGITTLAEGAWQIEGLADFRDSTDLLLANNLGRFQPNRMWYGETQVTFGERVYPPMPTGMVPGDPGWNGALATRRFAWSVLYRLPVPPTPTFPPPTIPPELGLYAVDEALASTREFTAYYVTLRRTQPTHRFAQQDHPLVPGTTGGLIDFANPPNSVIIPQIVASDLMFPVAWLVPLDLVPSGLPGSGIPGTAEVMLNAGPDNISPMLPPGSQFVVSGTGSVYRVEQREILATGSSPLTRLTLDRPLEVVDQASLTHFVWVYPPHIERDEGPASFFGPSPVVSIDVRTLTMSP